MVGLKQGSTLKNGKYQIVKTLGSGSFGITYLATTRTILDGQLGRMEFKVNVTIKEFFMSELNSRSSDGTSVEKTDSYLVKNYRTKFRREAENLSKLHHPNIVKVLEVFDENNTTYYVMEFIDGETIDDYIKASGRLPEAEALKITREVCGALSYMHTHKMLHLDLKPKNIMRDSGGHVFLIDFGLAKQYNDNGEPESSTTLGLGTPGYAPIEQAHYKQDGSFPATLDVYALGATLYKMLTGKTPPESSYVLNDGLPLSVLKASGVSQKAIAIVEKAMAPIRKDRYQTVMEILSVIDNSSVFNEETTIREEEKETTIDQQQEYTTHQANANNRVKAKRHRYEVEESFSIKKNWLQVLLSFIVVLCVLYYCTNRNSSSTPSKSKADFDRSAEVIADSVDANQIIIDSVEAAPITLLNEDKNKQKTESNNNESKTKKNVVLPQKEAESKRTDVVANAKTVSNNVKDVKGQTKTITTVIEDLPDIDLSDTEDLSDPDLNEQEIQPDPVYTVVEQQPEFPGGDAALMQYIKKNIKYPEYAVENSIQGRVTLSFIVEKDGSITNIEVMRSPAEELSKEAIRIVRSMPKWNPGKQRGNDVRVKYVLFVSFRL